MMEIAAALLEVTGDTVELTTVLAPKHFCYFFIFLRPLVPSHFSLCTRLNMSSCFSAFAMGH